MAAVLAGTALMGDVQTEESFNEEAGLHFVNFLSNHRDYMINTSNNIVEVIEEGRSRQIANAEGILKLTKAQIELNKTGKIDVANNV